jgi:membrane-bound metal-dependent hydrolase YbcI (DUF457 family)
MTWPTHSLFGMNTVWLLTPFISLFPDSDIGMLCAAAALGSLLPDLDASELKIKHLKLLGTKVKPFMLPSLIISRTDQHRGLLHSLWGLGMAALLALCAMPWTGLLMAMVLVLGYTSHLVADAATKSGIHLFYPSAKRYHSLPFTHHHRLISGRNAVSFSRCRCTIATHQPPQCNLRDRFQW